MHADVVHTTDSAWQVIAGPLTVRVTGTRFDLRWSAVTEEFSISVTEGSVAVAGSVVSQIQAGTMLALGVTGKKPSAILPNVPTFAAAGFPQVDPEAFRFVVAPAGIPSGVSQKLTAALTTIMASPEIKTRLVDNGFEPEFQTGKDAREFVVREIRKWRQAVKEAGVKPN